MRSLSIVSLVFISGWVSIPIAVAGAKRGICLVTGAILVERVFILVAGLFGSFGSMETGHLFVLFRFQNHTGE
jgi:hypothetical protein